MLKFDQLSVAPMEGITNFPMRFWLYLVSEPHAMTTPFLRLNQTQNPDVWPEDFAPELFELRGVLPYQLIPQFIAGDPELLLRTQPVFHQDLTPFIELNCGCPSPNSMGKWAGSGLLQDPEFFHKTITRLSEQLGPTRFAVKMRLGFDLPEESAALYSAIAELKLARLTVHGRTRADGYRGTARWDLIQAATLTVKSPVHASGDICGLESLKQLSYAAPNLDGAMIGRGVLRNPWVFREFRTGQGNWLDLPTLIHALFCYTLLQDLWQRQPGKLLAKILKSKINDICGTNFVAWEKLTAELTALVFGYPFLLTPESCVGIKGLSSVAFSRLKGLWAYLRSGLPEHFSTPSLSRSKSPEQFFALLWALDDLPETFAVGYRKEWDENFARLRG